MSINGSTVESYLNSLSYASVIKRDNNDYLIAFKLDTGAEIAFDPRTKTKASIFVANLPKGLISTIGSDRLTSYPPETPSTALGRVSSQLDSLPKKYRIEVKTQEELETLIEWQRWA